MRMEDLEFHRIATRRVAVVTNIPAPYRLPVFEHLAAEPDIDLKVFYCSGREPDREWNLGDSGVAQQFLMERYVSVAGRYIHINLDVWKALNDFHPDVVVTTGFNPTHLLAYLYARFAGAKHVAMTDGTLASEEKLSCAHRWIRRHIFAESDAFIGASDGAFALYRSYGIPSARIFKSHLCANNAAFAAVGEIEKKFDFIFCGRFVAVKNPLFALDVARGVAQRLQRRVSILYVGSGVMEGQIRAAAANAGAEIDAVFAGFARQEELPALYGSARVFLFPTSWDPWGVVANEACAAGLPVLVTEAAGAAVELVRDGENGFILPLDLEAWGDKAALLLSDATLYTRQSARARELVGEYTYDNAALGIARAVRHAVAGADVGRLRVVIVQRRLTHYRVPLFERLREMLAARGIDLDVVYGDPMPEEERKRDSGSLPWGIHVPCRYFLRGRLCWQNADAAGRGAHLLILPHENKLVFNYRKMLGRHRRAKAFWGHGRNFQVRPVQRLSELWKRYMAIQADWWFAYTDVSAGVLQKIGFPAERTTVLNNAVDTSSISQVLAAATADEVAALRAALAISPGPVGIMVASLHADKRISFLIEAARRIRAQVPDFQLVVVGDGPLADQVRVAEAASGGWFHWVGVRTGREKALLLTMARVMLNPGMVGLSILDSFVAGVPMVTTNIASHSPEIAYLESDVNGLVTADSINAFTAAAVSVLNDDALYQRLRKACLDSAGRYTLDHMTENFCDGIERCLAAFPMPSGLAAQTS